jgi:glycosyltransferase involved in cell wall biosynthesis
MAYTSKINVVMFWFMNDWGKYGRAYENIAKDLANHPSIGHVICVLPPIEKKDKSHAWPFVYHERTSNLTVLSPRDSFSLDGAPYKMRLWTNLFIQKLTLRILAVRLGLRKKNTSLWCFPPHKYIYSLLTTIPHKNIIVQIVDNNTVLEKLHPDQREFAQIQYTELARRAKAVIVSSDMNQEIFSRLNNRCYRFPNAVDTKFISSPTPLPCVASGSRPRVGYVGWISERTDLELLRHIAICRPEYDVILAGPSECNLNDLLELSNVHWLGAVPYENVPTFIKSLDACLIPHSDTPYCRSMSPLKLLQYLASGRPTVSTPVAGIESWKSHVYIADSYDEFVAALDSAIRDESLEKAQARISAASSETWKARVDEIVTTIFSDRRSSHYAGAWPRTS